MPVRVDTDTCIGCEACVSVCPVESMHMVDGHAECQTEVCIDCGACVSTCPVETIEQQ